MLGSSKEEHTRPKRLSKVLYQGNSWTESKTVSAPNTRGPETYVELQADFLAGILGAGKLAGKEESSVKWEVSM